jgi:alanyl-tRNA synthetase
VTAALSATRVTFPDGETAGTATVVHVVDAASGALVVLDATPFHPVDHTWPDQPGDLGTLAAGDDSADVVDTVMAALSDDGEFAVGADIPVRRGTPGWTWLVAHRIAMPAAPGWLAPGAEVTASVDRGHRDALSRGHTACHLASLALDAALADLWRKDAGTDTLGAPAFDARANQSSRIVPDGSVDEYRLGKSLRKAGFDTESFAAALADREAAVNGILAGWVVVGSSATSRIETEGPEITDRRTWVCKLVPGEARILCGGTHVHSLAAFSAITVSFDLSDPQLLVMTTTAVPA